jgi:hypothetical protein
MKVTLFEFAQEARIKKNEILNVWPEAIVQEVYNGLGPDFFVVCLEVMDDGQDGINDLYLGDMDGIEIEIPNHRIDWKEQILSFMESI